MSIMKLEGATFDRSNMSQSKISQEGGLAEVDKDLMTGFVLIPGRNTLPSICDEKIRHFIVKFIGLLERCSVIHFLFYFIFFIMLTSGEVQRIHSDSTPPLSDKTLMRSVCRRPIESCVKIDRQRS